MCACPANNPTVTGGEHCGEGEVELAASSGANCDEIRWYDSPSGSTVINTGITYVPTINSTKSFYVTCYNTALDCESSPRIEVVVMVNPLPPESGIRCNVLVNLFRIYPFYIASRAVIRPYSLQAIRTCSFKNRKYGIPATGCRNI